MTHQPVAIRFVSPSGHVTILPISKVSEIREEGDFVQIWTTDKTLKLSKTPMTALTRQLGIPS